MYDGSPLIRLTDRGSLMMTLEFSGECMNACPMSKLLSRYRLVADIARIKCSDSIDGVGEENPKLFAVAP